MFDSTLEQQREQQAIAERQAELTARVSRLAPVDGLHQSAFAPLRMARRGETSVVIPAVYQPCIAIVVQGKKRVVLNDEVLHYDPLNYLVVSVTMPVVSQVIEASAQSPYLCLVLDLDLEALARLILEVGDRGTPPVTSDRGLFVSRMGEPLLDAVLRLVRLLDTPEDLAVLAPVIQREIYYRILRGELAHRLTELVAGDGGSHRILRAIDWLKQSYTRPLRIEALAEVVHMSPSALHHRFKAVTAMSPLQFQKHLRLHEARRLMFAEGMDCAAAGHRVGYGSPSQFSREYHRLFGAPPRVDIVRLKESGVVT